MTPSHPLANFEIQKFYQNQPKFNVDYSRNSLPKEKDEAHVINHNEYESIGTRWTGLYGNGNNIICFDSFRVEHVPKEI